MARGLNKVLLIGNLGSDPEIKYTPSGTAIANFSLATSDRRKDASGEWEETTEWHRIVLFGKQAETGRDYLKKGSRIYLEGRIRTNSWDDQNGQKQSRTEIIGNSFLMLDGKPQDGDQHRPPAPRKSASGAPEQRKKPEPARDSFPEDDDLPF